MTTALGRPDYPSYARQTIDHPSRLARYSHRSRLRRAVSLLREVTPPDGAVLDFGAGPGHVLAEMARLGHRGLLLGYEPFQTVQAPDGVTPVTDLGQLPDHSVDTLSAWEVLEHLTEPELDTFVDSTIRLLRPGGRLVLSVPVVIGPPLLVKAVVRRLAFGHSSHHSAGELFRAAVLLKALPRPEVVAHAHKGFDFRALRDRLARRFRLERETTSPMPALPWWLNSQIFLVLERTSVVGRG